MQEKKLFGLFSNDDFSFPLTEEGSMEAYSTANTQQINSTAREILIAQTEGKLDSFFDNYMNLLLQSGATMEHVGRVYEISLQVIDLIKTKETQSELVGVSDLRPWAVDLVNVTNKVYAKH